MDAFDRVMRLSARKLVEIGEALGFQNLDPDAGRILITGATGVIGHRVAQRLLDAGYDHVRLGCHKITPLEDFVKSGAEVVSFDWVNEGTYASALEGVKSVLCTIPYKEGWSKHFPSFLSACEEAGVKHIVKLSFYHANIFNDPFLAVPLVREHSECDELLTNIAVPPVQVTSVMTTGSDGECHSNRMSYTIIHASHFMSNPFTLHGKQLRDSLIPSTFYGASHDHGVNYVSPNDVAEVAVRCLLEPRKHYDKDYTITGPGPITDQDVAALLSIYLQKPVIYVDQPLLLFTEQVKMSGDPKWMVDDLVALEEIKASGKEEDPGFVSLDFEKICGHPPETFEEYLRRTEMMVPVEETPLIEMAAQPSPIMA